VLALKPLDKDLEGRLTLAAERERDVVVGHLGFGISPSETKQATGRHMLDPHMRRVFDPYDRAFVMEPSERPAPDLLESDRVRMPTEDAGPGKQHSPVRDHDGAASDDSLARSQPSTQHCLAFGLRRYARSAMLGSRSVLTCRGYATTRVVSAVNATHGARRGEVMRTYQRRHPKQKEEVIYSHHRRQSNRTIA
jgi:hypothetical protein